MNSLTQFNRRRNSAANNERSLQTFPPERYTDLVRRRGGVISVPGKLKSRAGENAAATANNRDRRLTKLLLNVNIERSLGPVQVVMSQDNTVNDLIKAAIEIYVKERRRPFLKETDDKFHYELHYELHYSQFSLESLKGDEKLINLGSRNFFLCSKPATSVNSSCSEQANVLVNSPFPFTKLMDFLL